MLIRPSSRLSVVEKKYVATCEHEKKTLRHTLNRNSSWHGKTEILVSQKWVKLLPKSKVVFLDAKSINAWIHKLEVKVERSALSTACYLLNF
jgi:hypothetical protein